VRHPLAEPRLVALLLFLATAALFWPATSFEFLNYDDDVYVTGNAFVRAGLTAESVRTAFTSGAAANWHPLTWLSHQLDVTLFALDAGAHHRTSVLLHALNAALLFAALRALSGAHGPSALVAALFALHPLRVESVAWVAERKDVLAGTFFALVLWAHAGWVRRRRRGAYALSLLFLALGLLAKPMLVTVPAVLFVLDVWPLGRTDLGRAAREKLPHLALALAVALVTLVVQERGGALAELGELGAGARVAVALQALALYVARAFVPAGLAPFHPHPSLEPAAQLPPVLLAALALLVLGGTVLALCRRAPALGAGGLLFVGMLVPVLGLVPVGLAAWAERYTYLPSLGLALALVFGGQSLLPPRARAAAAGLLAVALVPLALRTRAALAPWHDSRTLFEHAVAVEPSSVAHAQLELEGRLAEALEHDEAALARRPRLAGLRVNRARLLERLGRTDEARVELEQALALEPELAPARARLGWLLVQAPGDDGPGLAQLRRALADAPQDDELQNLVAWVLATSPSAGAPEEARALAAALVARAPRQLAYQETLAAALARLGTFEEAARLQGELVARLPPAARAAPEERLRLYRAGKPYLAAP